MNRKSLRWSIPSAVVVALAVLPGAAGATAPPSFFETLPTGTLSVPTALEMPAAIPATEHTDVLYAEVPDYIKNNPNPAARYVQVFGSKHDGELYQTGGTERSSACLTSASPGNSLGGYVRWNENFSASTTVSPYARSYSTGPDGPVPKDFVTVAPVRIDRITNVREDGLTLQTSIALIDAGTLGSRLVQTSTVDFKLVRTLPGRLGIYAAKDADQVTFLVRHELVDGERAFGSIFGQAGNFESISSSDNCPVTFSLPVEHATAHTIVLQLEAVLEIRNANPEDFPVVGESDPPPSFETEEPREARLRPMQIGFSSTWLSQDKTPVVSISHGWTGKERVQPM